MNFKKLFLFVILLFITNMVSAQSILYQKVYDKALKSRQKINKITIFEKAETNTSKISKPDELRADHFVGISKSALNEVIKNKPSSFTLTVPVSETKSIEVTMIENKAATEKFEVFDGASGRKIFYEKAAAHYKGIVEGDKNSIVALSFFPDQVMGQVTTNGESFVIGKYGEDKLLHIIYKESDLETNFEFKCGSIGHDSVQYSEEESKMLTSQSKSASDKCIDLRVEIDHDIYLDKGLKGSVEYITALFNQSFILYENEGVKMSLKEVYVWTKASPYSYNAGNTTNDALEMLQSYQNSTGEFNAHLAHLVSYRAGGGYAGSFSALCNTNPDNRKCFSQIHASFKNVPNYSWSVMVITHEMGHLLGSRHTHACVWNGNNTAIDGCAAVEGTCKQPGFPAGSGTMMSYCHLQNVGINFSNGFGTQPGNLIRSRVANAACLSSCTQSCYDGIKNGDELGIDCGGSCENICPCENDTTAPVIESFTKNLNFTCDDTGHPDGSITNPFTHLKQAAYVQNAGIYYFSIKGLTFSSYVNTNGEILVAVDFGNGVGTLPSTASLSNTARGILNPEILASLTDANFYRINSSTGNVDVYSSNPFALKRITGNRAIVSAIEDIGIVINLFGVGGASFNMLTCYNTTKYTLAEKILHMCGDVNGFTWVPVLDLARENYSAGQVSASTSFNLWVKANLKDNECLHKTTIQLCDNIIPDLTADNLVINDNCASKDQLTITQSPPAGTVITGPTEVSITATDTSGNSTSVNFTVRLDNMPPVIESAVSGLTMVCDPSLEPKGTAADPFISLKQARRVTTEGVYHFKINGTTFSSVVNSSGEILVAQDYGNGVGGLPQLTQFSADDRGILSPQILATLTDAIQLRIKSSSGNINVTSTNATLLSRLRASKTLIIGSTDLSLAQTFTGTGSNYFQASSCVNNIGTNLNENIIYLCGNVNGFTWIPSWPIQREVYQSGEISDTTRFTLWIKTDINNTDCFNGEAVLLCNNSVPDLTGANVVATDNCTARDQLVITQSPAPGASVTANGQVTITVTDQFGNSSQKNIPVKADDIKPVITTATNGLSLSCDLNLEPKGTADAPFTSLKQARRVTAEGIYYFNINGNAFSSVVSSSGEILVAQDYGNGAGDLPQLSQFSANARGILTPQVLSALTDAVQVRIKSSSGRINVVSTNASVLSRLRSNIALASGSGDLALAKSFIGTGSAYFSASTCTSALTPLNRNIISLCGNYNGIHWTPSSSMQRESFKAGEVSATTRFTLWVKPSEPQCQMTGIDIKCENVVPDMTGNNVAASDNCSSPLTITQDPPAGTPIQGNNVTVKITATDAAGNSAESSVYVFRTCSETVNNDIILAKISNTHDNQPKMILHPNPATTVINVDVTDTTIVKSAKIAIYSLSGQLKKEISLDSSRITIPVDDLPAATYLIVFSNADSKTTLTKKFIKK